jgi:hypothetical protein
LGLGRGAHEPSPGVGYTSPVAMAYLEPQLGLDEPAGRCEVGGSQQPGQMVWSLSTETLIALTDPNKLTLRWTLDEEVWGRYQTQLGLTGPPRLRVWIWRF